MENPYLRMINEQWDTIMMAYYGFKDKTPIIEFDITNGKIFSYSAKEYIQTLSRRTRDHTKEQYKEAMENNKFMLFVKDYEKRILRSYIFDLPLP